MFLALDSVFGHCSVALIADSGEVISCETRDGKREQTQHILPMIDNALEQAHITLEDLTALVFNRGPGAFSGIRINTAVVQALAVAQDLPCVGISSLQVLAQAAYEQHGIVECYAAHDARMKQVYLGKFIYMDSGMQPVTLNTEGLDKDNIEFECLVDYEKHTSQSLALVGDGAPLLAAHHGQQIVDTLQLDAAILGKLGWLKFARQGGSLPEQALPVYLRNHAWKTLKEQNKARE